MLCRPYFTELFLTRSLARPRLLFGVLSSDRHVEWLFFSSPQPQNPYEKSSLVVASKFHVKISRDFCRYMCRCSYASSLLYFQGMQISKDDDDTVPMICNPITGQYAILPKLSRHKQRKSILGYDPINKQFKVLFMAYPYCDDYHKILTLGTGNMRWRNIECPLTHDIFNWCEGICINGILYYLGRPTDESSYDKGPFVIVCFDVRSEKFKIVDTKFCWLSSDLILINYKGKLGRINLKYASNGGFPLELCMWILEDVEKHEWSKYVYSLWDDSKIVKVDCNFSVVGMTATGEIVLSIDRTSKPYYVFYFSPKSNSLQSVEIKGFGEYLEKLKISGRVFAFVDHVEDLNVNNIKQLNSGQLRPK
ncbi:putative F-box protein [Cardamine amara subsp. amara]|uniref:F-box protein n=1 Tax=Cardamine amara subsp. amara TaxID=228776 RepID=A0ABD1C117_CARAN